MVPLPLQQAFDGWLEQGVPQQLPQLLSQRFCDATRLARSLAHRSWRSWANAATSGTARPAYATLKPHAPEQPLQHPLEQLNKAVQPLAERWSMDQAEAGEACEVWCDLVPAAREQVASQAPITSDAVLLACKSVRPQAGRGMGGLAPPAIQNVPPAAAHQLGRLLASCEALAF